MALKLEQLVANRATATIDFGGGNVLTVDYYPARITSQLLLDIAAASNGAQETTTLADQMAVIAKPAELLAQLLAAWDLVEDAPDAPDGADGVEAQPVPIDLEHLNQLGLAIQWQILGGVIQAQAGEASAPTGSAKARP